MKRPKLPRAFKKRQGSHSKRGKQRGYLGHLSDTLNLPKTNSPMATGQFQVDVPGQGAQLGR